MALIKGGRMSLDPFHSVGAEGELPADGDVLVSLARWQAQREELLRRPGRIGVKLASDQPPALIASDLGHFALVALEFPAFRDGRAYSYARLLREQFGYTGEIRAVGDVLLEQLHFMVRAGFDAFELDSADPEADFATAVGEFSVWYQPATDDRPSALELRHRHAR
jgi:uncharacterized protein (DUF934 family)